MQFTSFESWGCRNPLELDGRGRNETRKLGPGKLEALVEIEAWITKQITKQITQQNAGQSGQ